MKISQSGKSINFRWKSGSRWVHCLTDWYKMLPEKIGWSTFRQNKGNLNAIHMHQDVLNSNILYKDVPICFLFFIGLVTLTLINSIWTILSKRKCMLSLQMIYNLQMDKNQINDTCYYISIIIIFKGNTFCESLLDYIKTRKKDFLGSLQL